MEVSGHLHAAGHLSEQKWAAVHTVGDRVSPGADLHTAENFKLRNHTAVLHYVTIHIFLWDGPNTLFGCMNYIQILYFLRIDNDFNNPVFLSRPVNYINCYIICIVLVVSPTTTLLKLVLLKF